MSQTKRQTAPAAQIGWRFFFVEMSSVCHFVVATTCLKALKRNSDESL